MQKDTCLHNWHRLFFKREALNGESLNYGIMLALACATNIKLMKTSTNIDAILKAIDFELKTLLKKDLENFKMMKENKQAALKKAA